MTDPQSHFYFSNGKLSVDGYPLEPVIKKLNTPLYVYSSVAIRASIEELKKGLSGLNHLICYAVKANSNLGILSFIKKTNIGMDLVSVGELKRALQVGVDPQKCVFSGVGKTEKEITFTIQKKIHSFNVESVEELELISRVAEKCKIKVNIALRYNPDVDPKTHPYISTGLKENKFGLEKNEILEIVKNIKRHSFLKISGLSVHIGSQILTLKPFDDAFAKLKKLAKDVELLMKARLDFLDLGGGLGVVYQNEKTVSIKHYTQLIQKHFGKKSDLKARYEILIEPGRLIMANAGALLTTVLFEKKRDKKRFLIVDAAMNDLLRPALYESYHDIVPLQQNKQGGSTINSDVVGPVCESADFFARKRKLSKKIKSKDILAILSAGAYGMSMSGNYNSRPRAAEVLVVDGKKIKNIRLRETEQDLWRGEKK